MKKIIALMTLGTLLVTSEINAQAKPAWPSIFEKINKEVLDHSNAYTSLKIASETIGHRLTGSENGKKAEQFAYDLLKSYGFNNVKFQPFEVECWSRGLLGVSF